MGMQIFRSIRLHFVCALPLMACLIAVAKSYADDKRDQSAGIDLRPTEVSVLADSANAADLE